MWGKALEAGKARRATELGPLEVAAGGLVAIGEGLEHLRELARGMTALYVGGMGARDRNFYNTLVRRYGYEKEAELIQDLYLDGKKEEAAAAVPAELLEETSLIGPAGLRAGADRRLPGGRCHRPERDAGRPRPAGHAEPAPGVGVMAGSTDRNRRLVLAARPAGMVDESTVRLEEEAVPDHGPEGALVRVRYLSIDPTIRTWMNDAPGYLPAIGIGEVVRGGGIGEVVASTSERYQVGDLVFGMLGWQDYAVADEGLGAMQVIPAGIDPLVALSVFGITGMTAYFGLIDVGRVQEGDTVVVSGAAGATGSVVGQLARIKGAGRVVGIAGTEEKCRWLTDELGFDAAVNYRTENVGSRLRALCPGGIDLYFDNVGGEILDICLGQLALKGRVVLCGAISTYNETGPTEGSGELPEPHRDPGPDGGLSHPRLPRPVPRGPAGHGRLGGRRQDQARRARGRGPGPGPGGAQPALQRGQHGQGDRPGRLTGWA